MYVNTECQAQTHALALSLAALRYDYGTNKERPPVLVQRTRQDHEQDARCERESEDDDGCHVRVQVSTQEQAHGVGAFLLVNPAPAILQALNTSPPRKCFFTAEAAFLSFWPPCLCAQTEKIENST